MSYKYTIIQENTDNKARLTYEFSANDETEMVDELNSFLSSIGFDQSGYLSLIPIDDGLYDDIDSEVEEYSDHINPEVQDYMNFEFPVEYGQGQTEYNFVSTDTDKIAEMSQSAASFPFPLDRPSQSTYRVDSIYETNSNDETKYYGA